MFRMLARTHTRTHARRSLYSQAMCRVERVAALAALALPALAQPAAAAFAKHGEACAAASVVLLAAPRGDGNLISWALQVCVCVCVCVYVAPIAWARLISWVQQVCVCTVCIYVYMYIY
jgi:hypothetical protein